MLYLTGQFHTLLTEECTIAVLSLRSNKMCCADMVPFSAALANNKSLTSLSLNNNYIADEGAQHIAQVIIILNSYISFFIFLFPRKEAPPTRGFNQEAGVVRCIVYYLLTDRNKAKLVTLS